MAGFIISRKLTKREAMDAVHDLTQWFINNPRRRVCRTDLGWKVRRDHVVEDITQHTAGDPAAPR